MNQIEPWLGGGIYGLVVIFALQLFRRTKDVDERRDAMAEVFRESERQLIEDRNNLLVELRAMREELDELRRRTEE